MIVHSKLQEETVQECIVCLDPIDYCTGHGALAGAVAEFQDGSDSDTSDIAEALVREGKARWSFDPDVRDVYGLIVPGTNRALVVVYAPDKSDDPTEEWDWEISDLFFDMAQELEENR